MSVQAGQPQHGHVNPRDVVQVLDNLSREIQGKGAVIEGSAIIQKRINEMAENILGLRSEVVSQDGLATLEQLPGKVQSLNQSIESKVWGEASLGRKFLWVVFGAKPQMPHFDIKPLVRLVSEKKIQIQNEAQLDNNDYPGRGLSVSSAKAKLDQVKNLSSAEGTAILVGDSTTKNEYHLLVIGHDKNIHTHGFKFDKETQRFTNNRTGESYLNMKQFISEGLKIVNPGSVEEKQARRDRDVAVARHAQERVAAAASAAPGITAGAVLGAVGSAAFDAGAAAAPFVAAGATAAAKGAASIAAKAAPIVTSGAAAAVSGAAAAVTGAASAVWNWVVGSDESTTGGKAGVAATKRPAITSPEQGASSQASLVAAGDGAAVDFDWSALQQSANQQAGQEALRAFEEAIPQGALMDREQSEPITQSLPENAPYYVFIRSYQEGTGKETLLLEMRGEDNAINLYVVDPWNSPGKIVVTAMKKQGQEWQFLEDKKLTSYQNPQQMLATLCQSCHPLQRLHNVLRAAEAADLELAKAREAAVVAEAEAAAAEAAATAAEARAAEARKARATAPLAAAASAATAAPIAEQGPRQASSQPTTAVGGGAGAAGVKLSKKGKAAKAKMPPAAAPLTQDAANELAEKYLEGKLGGAEAGSWVKKIGRHVATAEGKVMIKNAFENTLNNREWLKTNKTTPEFIRKSILAYVPNSWLS